MSKSAANAAEHQVPVDYDAYLQTPLAGQSRFEVKVTPSQFWPHLVDAFIRAIALGSDDTVTALPIRECCQLNAYAQQRRQCRAIDDELSVPIRFALPTRHSQSGRYPLDCRVHLPVTVISRLIDLTFWEHHGTMPR